MKFGEILKDRGLRFYKNGVELFNREEYDLAAFNLEQATQLLLKYAILNFLGDFDKTHEISKLLNDYLSLIEDKEKLVNLIKKYERTIVDLEEAYIRSRYIPSKFFKDQVHDMIKFVEELIEIIGNK
ncbi:MAG: HEPN domain-containing protein [Caldisericia bacterium]